MSYKMLRPFIIKVSLLGAVHFPLPTPGYVYYYMEFCYRSDLIFRY